MLVLRSEGVSLIIALAWYFVVSNGRQYMANNQDNWLGKQGKQQLSLPLLTREMPINHGCFGS
jgi:hypothetical protein